jgi:hypothetical protein
VSKNSEPNSFRRMYYIFSNPIGSEGDSWQAPGVRSGTQLAVSNCIAGRDESHNPSSRGTQPRSIPCIEISL